MGMVGRIAARWSELNRKYMESTQHASDIAGGLGAMSKVLRMMLQSAILAVGAEKFFGPGQAEEIRFVGTNVSAAIVPGSGHWIMEENPGATTKLVLEFLAK